MQSGVDIGQEELNPQKLKINGDGFINIKDCLQDACDKNKEGHQMLRYVTTRQMIEDEKFAQSRVTL